MNFKKYINFKDELFQVANALGYAHANIEKSQVLVDISNHDASIIIYFNTGPRYYFGTVNFKQNAYSENFLKRFLPFNSTTPFSPNTLIDLQQKMMNSNFFSRVDVKALDQKTLDYHIPVDILLSPVKSRQYLFGLGYGTDTRIRGTFGAQFHRLTDTGQQFKTILQASKVNQSLQTAYSIPGKNPVTEQYIIGGGIQYLQPQSYHIVLQKINFSYLVNQQNWQRSFSLNLQHEDDASNKYVMAYPSLNLLRIFTDNPLHTTNGERYNITFNTGLYNTLGESQTKLDKTYFAQGQVSAKLIRTYFDNTRIILQGMAGSIFAKNAAEAPLTLRFFSGGADNIRGYGYQDIGPGNRLIFGSGEFQQRVWGSWYGALFYDTGNVTNNWPQLNKLYRDVGFGIVYLSTIGPIEISLARPLGDPLDKHFRFQLSMGPDL